MYRHVWTILFSGSLLFTGLSFKGSCVASAQESSAPFSFSENGVLSDSLFQDSGVETDGESAAFSSRLFLDNTTDETDGTLQLTQYPFESSGATEVLPEEVLSDSGWGPLSYLKQQLDCLPKDRRGLQFKDSSATMTVLPGQGSDGFFFSTLDVRTNISPARLPVFRVTPRFGWHLTGGPDVVDVPSQLYDTGVDFSLYAPLSQKFTLYTAVGPSLFTDGKNLSSSSFRMTASAIGFYKWSDTTQLALGFLYLDREDITALPAVGVMYRPSDRLKLDFFFPRPKFAYRLTTTEDYERWIYLAGEFGGNSWAVERDFGAEDIFTYRDYRLILGVEKTGQAGVRWLVEGGFIFNREIEYASGIGGADPGSTGMIRVGMIF